MFNSNNNNTCHSKPDVGARDSGSQSTDRNTSVMEGKLEQHRPDRTERGCGTCRMAHHVVELSDRIGTEISLIPMEENHTK